MNNQMIDGDCGECTYSPNYRGTTCNTCGKTTHDPDDNGNCPDCEHVECTLCGTMNLVKKSAKYLGRWVCNDCAGDISEEGESVHYEVFTFIERENQKRKNLNAELDKIDISAFVKMIANEFRPLLTPKS